MRMTSRELAGLLTETYIEAANAGESVSVAMCLFGMRYVNEILDSGVTVHRLCRLACIPKLGPTINLGMNLSEHVTIREERLRRPAAQL